MSKIFDDEDDNDKKVSKNTEKVVANLRIKQIENGIRSISSILDTRTLYDLDPIERKDINGAREREKQEKRNNTRRMNNLIFSSMTNQGALALELLKEKGVEVKATTDEYGDEERIWKHKYHTPTYTQKRKFENPKLHEYYQHLNSEEQKEFQIQCRDALYKLSSDLRKNHTNLKNEMDNRGIFHPAANAHRAHCMYLLKLYKEIDASALEDPVLRSMNAARPDSPAIEPYRPSTLGSSRGPASRPTTSSGLKVREPLIPRIRTPVVEKKKPLSALLNSASAPQLTMTTSDNPQPQSQSQQQLQKNTTKPAANPNPNTTPVPVPVKTETNPSSTSRINANSRPRLPHQGSFAPQSQNLATKPLASDPKKHQKPGAGTMVEAAVGMDGFIEGCSSDWMIHRLQREQIDSAVNIHTTQMSTPLPTRTNDVIWKQIPELNSPQKERKGPSLGAAESHPIISFNEFQELFQKFVQEAEKEVQDSTSPQQIDSSNPQVEEAIPVEDEGKNIHKSDSVPQNPNLPPVSAKNRKDASASRASSRKSRNSNRKPGDLSYLGPLNDPVSQRIISNQQPHLEAFLNIRTKKKHSLDLVKKMLTTLPETTTGKIDVSVRPSTDHHRKSHNGSQVGLQAVRAQTAKPSLSGTSPTRSPSRRKLQEGFRNVFKDDDSIHEDKDSSLGNLESQTSLSEDAETESEDTASGDDESPDGRQKGNKSPSYSRVYIPRSLGKVKKGRSKIEGAQLTQEKQSTVWDVLQVPTIDRITIMSKYSTGEYAPVYHDSVNHWSLIAIIVSIRIQLRNLYLKYQRGILDLPTEDEIESDWFFHQVLEAVPIQLRRNYHPENSFRHKKKPESEEQVSLLLEEIRSSLTYEDEETNLATISRIDLQNFILQSVKIIDSRLIRELNEAERKYLDTIPYGSIPCKEWLGAKAQRFPPPRV